MKRIRIDPVMEFLQALRAQVSCFFMRLSILLLFAGLILLACTIFDAELQGYYPDFSADNWPMNHGPWRYNIFQLHDQKRIYTEFLGLSFLILLLSVVSSMTSVVLQYTRLRLLIFMLCLTVFLASMDRLYWLID
jgi:hypothetical protein